MKIQGVHQYSPIIDEKIRKHLKPTSDSWPMDETYLKMKGKKALKAIYNQQSRVITIDKYAGTEVAISEMIYSRIVSLIATIRKVKYLNNIIVEIISREEEKCYEEIR